MGQDITRIGDSLEIPGAARVGLDKKVEHGQADINIFMLRHTVGHPTVVRASRRGSIITRRPTTFSVFMFLNFVLLSLEKMASLGGSSG